jgi:prolyl 4-hydroxylase
MPIDPVKFAYDYAAQGRLGDAVNVLEAAGAEGDAVALAELTAWYLRGDLVPRNLSLARDVLRRTVAIGHVDAALLQIALTANGSGGVSDWAAALSLLRSAAVNDPVAAQNLALLDDMSLDGDGYPPELPLRETLSESPVVFRLANAFSQRECLHLAGIAHDKLEPGVVVDPKSGQNLPHPIRTSYGTAIGPAQEDLVVAALNRRIAAMTDTALGNGEPLQVLRYAPGQQYRLHSDALTRVTNQRTVTAIVYLNEGFGGGETDFPAIGVHVQPRAGDVLVFHNALPDGRMDPRARHAGLPVTNGVKWIATRWIRAAPYDPWTAR